MSVPNSKYVGSLPAKSTTGTKIIRLTSSSESDVVIKERFYLDGFCLLKRKNSDNSITTVWAGTVVKNSPNYFMHNTNRHGWLNAAMGNENEIVLEDAGLNTLPFCNTPELIDDTVGSVQAKTLIKTAFYLDSDSYGVSVQINNGSILDQKVDDLILENTSVYRNLPLIGYAYIKSGDVIKIWATVSNSEGEYRTRSYLRVVVKPKKWVAKYDSTYASWAIPSTDTKIIYSGLIEMDYGSEVYKNIGMTEYADTGYYVIDGWWYEVSSDETPQMKSIVVAKGRAISGQYPSGDPGNIPGGTYVPVEAYFGTTRNMVCRKAKDGDPSELYKFFMNTASNIYYVDNVGSSYVADGYYLFPDYEPSVQVWGMTTGIRLRHGLCT